MPDRNIAATHSQPANATAMCEATRRTAATCEVSSGEPGFPYRLCEAAKRRFQRGVLRPAEHFNLAAAHGFGGKLREDIYDARGRRVRWSWSDVLRRPWYEIAALLHPAPRLRNVANNLERLLDFAIARGLETTPDDWLSAMQRQPRGEILTTLQHRVGDGAPAAVENACYELVALLELTEAGPWIRRQWRGYPRAGLAALIDASNVCLPADERIALLFSLLDQTSSEELFDIWRDVERFCSALYSARAAEVALHYLKLVPLPQRAECAALLSGPLTRAAVTEWIERDVLRASPSNGGLQAALDALDWGRLAAVCRPEWPTIRRWLEAGPPLAHAAIETLMTCGGLADAPLSPAVRYADRTLLKPETLDAMTTVLRKCATTLGLYGPAVHVSRIVTAWPEIISGNRRENERER